MPRLNWALTSPFSAAARVDSNRALPRTCAGAGVGAGAGAGAGAVGGTGRAAGAAGAAVGADGTDGTDGTDGGGVTLGEEGTAAGTGGATDGVGVGVALVEEPAGCGLCAPITPGPKVPPSTIVIANTLFNVVNMR